MQNIEYGDSPKFCPNEILGKTIHTRSITEVKEAIIAGNDFACPFTPVGLHKGGTKCIKRETGICCYRSYRGDNNILELTDQVVTGCARRFLEGHTAFDHIANVFFGSSRYTVHPEYLLSGQKASTRSDYAIISEDKNKVVLLEVQSSYLSKEKGENYLETLSKLSDSANYLPAPTSASKLDKRSTLCRRALAQLREKKQYVYTEKSKSSKLGLLIDDLPLTVFKNLKTFDNIEDCELIIVSVRYETGEGDNELEIAQTIYTSVDNLEEALQDTEKTTASMFFERLAATENSYMSPEIALDSQDQLIFIF